jgi:uncharacterized membrane protein YhaH (DUF805 family)
VLTRSARLEFVAMRIRFADLWRWNGTVGRAPYLLIGVLLLVLKSGLDWLTAHLVFGRSWTLFNYFVLPGPMIRVLDLPEEDRLFYGTMLALSLPFIYVGVALTVKRLRDAQLPTGLVLLFFIPLVNLIFFILLGLLPARPTPRPLPPGALERARKPPAFSEGPYAEVYRSYTESERWQRLRSAHRRITRESSGASAVLSLAVCVPVAIAWVALSTFGLHSYGWGLFVGTPFGLGMGSVILHGLSRPQGFGSCLGVAFLAATLVGVAALALAMEGAICLIMAAPIGYFLVFLGAAVGFVIQARPWSMQDNPTLLLALLVTLPALMAAESASAEEPALRDVCSVVEIDAPPEVVWRQVIAFPDLAEPDDWVFRTGIAYPKRAEIHGRGVGAVRHCVFSTGAFVEPIDVWQEPECLAFRVADQPEPMKEWSPFDVHPPHLDHYLVSRRGQFRLVRLPDGRTRLEGTTRYTNRMWPAAYWNVWSDAIIHRIHLRVLNHVKHLAEAEARK